MPSIDTPRVDALGVDVPRVDSGELDAGSPLGGRGVSAFREGFCAVTTVGGMACWYGDAATADAPLRDGTGLGAMEVRGVVEVANGCGRTTDGRVYCYGVGATPEVTLPDDERAANLFEVPSADFPLLVTESGRIFAIGNRPAPTELRVTSAVVAILGSRQENHGSGDFGMRILVATTAGGTTDYQCLGALSDWDLGYECNFIEATATTPRQRMFFAPDGVARNVDVASDGSLVLSDGGTLVPGSEAAGLRRIAVVSDDDLTRSGGYYLAGEADGALIEGFLQFAAPFSPLRVTGMPTQHDVTAFALGRVTVDGAPVARVCVRYRSRAVECWNWSDDIRTPIAGL